ncbi:hypothetical protein COW36_02365 [bacterium (Candidatus Blackallbacteria) CG17_big_fil_post_rev_8_21_14_2_50_48_46]|uniref:Uncharacterized protein n=1 Tax=bacterium (Candidatus Blackallbacteria) CG17_big_fil_post_rev_8_21_14_2_50_48_46 TaxID=2014261 RepID=A0A2M7GA01_9BACT|nr:MAG: hypothetical protein COW64_13105 [bacterium (Candidatus Blackallbacteria) CG18_big_fil_WC_8_21_14_2_50_49_26]PIW18973.1 MAG: hypothetical protein COW36_02365 [bacterium (Candidatus Blackallbacteria) CG17_big_fil_post_rev_8_21_14_2_50_48_46]PIW44659.1 MAG: hypothetical protein COW20_23750 [bacterium (Candidatus Blackallbacteria) CG13_big_fil_rev_8_21_14_2_50_49_14]
MFFCKIAQGSEAQESTHNQMSPQPSADIFLKSAQSPSIVKKLQSDLNSDGIIIINIQIHSIGLFLRA